MKVNIKKLHPNAVVPKYAKAGDAGMEINTVTWFIRPDWPWRSLTDMSV
jgi:hypothetical protein